MGRSCPACGHTFEPRAAFGPFVPTNSGTYSSDNFSLVSCPNCETVYLSPAPTTDDLRVMYVDSVQFTHEVYTAPERIASINEYMLDGLKRAMNATGITREPAVLEIGAGYAWMCRAAKGRFPNARTVAQDVTAEVSLRCPWVDDYIVADIDDELLERMAPFDVISMTHVIEHLVEPEVALRILRQRLAAGGAMFITAPYGPRGDARTRDPEAWRSFLHMHVPAHTQYFSEQGLHTLAGKAGLRIVHWNSGHDDGQAFEAILACA